jgi:hypothetical protein
MFALTLLTEAVPVPAGCLGVTAARIFFLRSCAIKALVLFKHPLFSHPLLSMSVDGRTQPRMSVEMMQELHSAFTGTSLIGQLTGQPLRADQDIFCGEQGEVGKPHSEASWLVDRL